MSDDELEVMKSAMNLAVEDQLVVLEKRTMVLATSVSGLFSARRIGITSSARLTPRLFLNA